MRGKSLMTFVGLLVFWLPGQETHAALILINKDSMAAQVKQEFLHSWNAYKKYAWGHDGLRPLSKTFYDWHGVPFYLSAVDALDTMILMGLKEEADSTREFVAAHL